MESIRPECIKIHHSRFQLKTFALYCHCFKNTKTKKLRNIRTCMYINVDKHM